MGGEGLSGDRGAHNEPKTKRAAADAEEWHTNGPAKALRSLIWAPLGRSVRFTLIEPMVLLAFLGRSKVLLVGSGVSLGGTQAPPRAPGGPSGMLGAVLGGPLGDLGAALGVRGARSGSTFGKQAALQHHRFSSIECYILSVGRGLGGSWGERGGRQNGRQRVEWGPSFRAVDSPKQNQRTTVRT